MVGHFDVSESYKKKLTFVKKKEKSAVQSAKHQREGKVFSLKVSKQKQRKKKREE